MNLNRRASVSVTMLTTIDFSAPASHTPSREYERKERKVLEKKRLMMKKKKGHEEWGNR